MRWGIQQLKAIEMHCFQGGMTLNIMTQTNEEVYARDKSCEHHYVIVKAMPLLKFCITQVKSPWQMQIVLSVQRSLFLADWALPATAWSSPDTAVSPLQSCYCWLPAFWQPANLDMGRHSVLAQQSLDDREFPLFHTSANKIKEDSSSILSFLAVHTHCKSD